MKFFILYLFLTALSAFAFSDPKSALAEARAGKAILVDVREKHEIEQGMVNDALWLPLSTIEQNDSWKKDFRKTVENKKIYLYCRSGKRAERVKELFKKDKLSAHNLGGYEDLIKIKDTIK